jgi:ABC-2 type transport system ATP-binding protein
MAEPLIAIAMVSRKMGTRACVSDVRMLLMPGEIIGLVGANGGGKTTTLRMLAGLLRPDSGEGYVLGMPIMNGERPWQQLGYMAQKTALYPELTVRENLRFRCEAYGLNDAQTSIAKSTKAYGLDPVLDKRVAHLSGGWGKRAQFAATVIHNPRLLLLDEPTAGLDAVTRRDLWGWIEDLAASGTGVVISTHDLAEAQRLKRVIVYHDGKAQSEVDPAALIAAAGTADLESAVVKLAEAG